VIAASLADLFGFVLLLMLLAVAGWRRASDAAAFTVASRGLAFWPLVATLVMTEFNTSTLIAFAAVGYSAGPMAVALPAVFLVGLTFYTVTVSRAWKRFDRLSVAELFTARYSRSLGRTASVLLLAAMSGFTATYVKSLTLLFAPFVPASIPVPVTGAVLTLVVLGAVLPGGLVSVVRADIVGFAAAIILFPALWLIGRARSGALEAVFPPDQLFLDPVAQWDHPALPMRFVATLIVLTCFTYIAAPWYGQKIFAARDTRTAFRAVGASALFVFLLYAVIVLAAAHLRVESPALSDPQLAVPTMIGAWLPAGARGMGFAVLFGAAMTTLAGVWSAMAAMVAADLAGPRARTVRGQRLLLATFATISWLGATFLVDDILDRLILANIPVAALAFALLAGFHWPRATPAGAWASIVVGVAWGIGCFVVVGEAGGYTWPWAMYGLPLIFGTGALVSLVTAPPRGPPAESHPRRTRRPTSALRHPVNEPLRRISAAWRIASAVVG
jgi:SSS family solute:Na+ symporter